MTTKFGLGLAALGRPEYINIRESNNIDKSEKAFKKNAMDMLNTAYQLGIRYFDTAPSYGNGENYLLAWQNQENYKDSILATKWGYTYVANWELGYTGSHEVKEHSIDKLIEQWEVSKEMLPNLKVYQIHSATLESGVLENNEVLDKLFKIKQETGLLIGLTTSGPQQSIVLEKASKIENNGQVLFDVFQVTYNVFEQSTYHILMELIKQGKKIVIKEGVANGRIFNSTPPLLLSLANKYNVGVDAIALRFIFDDVQPFVILSGAFSEKQLTDNLKALDFSLTPSEVQDLKDLKMDSETYWNQRKELNWN